MAAKQITSAPEIFFQTIPRNQADETGGGLCCLLGLSFLIRYQPRKQ